MENNIIFILGGGILFLFTIGGLIISHYNRKRMEALISTLTLASANDEATDLSDEKNKFVATRKLAEKIPNFINDLSQFQLNLLYKNILDAGIGTMVSKGTVTNTAWQEYYSVFTIGKGIFVKVTWSYVPFKDFQPGKNTDFMFKHLHEINPEVKENKNQKLIPFISKLNYIIDNDHPDLIRFEKVLADSKILPIETEPMRNPARIFTIQKGPFGGLSAVPSTDINFEKFTNPESVDLSFAGVEFQAKKLKKVLPMTKVLEIITQGVLDGLTPAFVGPIGSGKTSILKYLIQKLSKHEEIAVLNVSGFQLEGINPTDLFSCLRDLKARFERIVVIMDEVDFLIEGVDAKEHEKGKSRSTLLGALLVFMDGLEGDQLKTTFILAANTEEENILEAVWDRIHILITLGYLNAPRAIARAKFYEQNEMEEGFVYDYEKLNATLEADKSASLRTIINCKIPQKQLDLIEGALNKAVAKAEAISSNQQPRKKKARKTV